MKTAMVHATNAFYTLKNNEWDSFRAEGRIPINIGFGLSLLGYDVNIVYQNWNLTEPKKTWNNVILSSFPIKDYYDTVLTFSTFNILYNLKFGTALSIVYDDAHISRTKEFINTTGKNVKFIYNHRETIWSAEEKVRDIGKIFYVPPLFPIPSINVGFLPCSYNPELPELKLYLHYTGWPQNTTISGDRFANKEQLIIDHLKRKGYKIKLSILVENREAIKVCPIINDDVTFFYSSECNHLDIINIIRSADMCITHGAPVFTGNSATDIVSLGKPLIYIGDGRPGNEWIGKNLNLLYNCPDNIIYIQEQNSESIEKIDRIIKNPIDLCKKYANALKDLDFNTWRYIVKDVFDTNQ